jgi:D-ornithine 4,5-aminomutase subunit alpha
MKERKDDYLVRREHLKKLSNKELRLYFLELSEKIVDPLLDLSYKNTSKSIERSVLLRMGFSSIDSKAIVDILDENNLLCKGAGHSVYLLSLNKKISLEKAGELIKNGDEIEFLLEYFNIYE